MAGLAVRAQRPMVSPNVLTDPRLILTPELQPRVLNLNALIADLSTMLQRLLREDIALTTVLDLALGHVKAERGITRQVLHDRSLHTERRLGMIPY